MGSIHHTSRGAFAGAVALLWLCMLIAPAASLDVAYCSSQNTAGDFDAQSWEWQSNGWCADKCNGLGQYAYAVILTNKCWCSNYAPEDQEDTSKCDDNCPGYPSEKCGNKADNLYIYIELANSPSGTTGASMPTSSNPSSAPPSSSSSSSTETSRDPETVVQTVTKSQVVTPTPTPADTSTGTTLKTTTSSSEETTTVMPQTSVRIVTESGNVVTQTVVTTPTSALSKTPAQKSSSSTGAIVGGVVGGIAGIAAVVGGVFLLLRRRRQQQRMQDDGTQSGVQRNTSTMSKAGLLHTEKDPQYPPRIATAFAKRQSRTLDQDSISPISGSDRRNSRLQVDQRLNPSAIFAFDNSSRTSVASIDDSRDYHRTLNVRNPDPE